MPERSVQVINFDGSESSLLAAALGWTAPWMDRAACKSGVDPDLFYPSVSDETSRAQAQAICNRCPVKGECAAYSTHFDEKYGVWAGEDKEAQRLKATNRHPRPCGTETAHRRHLRNGEEPCTPCRDAHEAFEAAKAGRSKSGRAPRCQKLTENEVKEIRYAAAAGHSARSLANLYDISSVQVHNIVKRRAWAHI